MLTARGLSRGAVNEVLQPPGLLREGNGLLNLGFAAASVGGAALGGLLVEAFSGLDGAARRRGLVRRHRRRPRHLPEPAALGQRAEPFLQRAREGLRYARTNRTARVLIGGESFAVIFFTLIVPIEIVYAAETLGHRRPRIRRPAVGVGRRDRARQPGLPGRSPTRCQHAHPFVHPRDRFAPYLGMAVVEGALDGLRVLGARRPRQRRPVGLGHDRAAGVDAATTCRRASPACSSRSRPR